MRSYHMYRTLKVLSLAMVLCSFRVSEVAMNAEPTVMS